VGNEPADLSLDPAGTTLIVTLQARSSMVFLNPTTLASSGEFFLTDPFSLAAPSTIPSNATKALKAPRRMVLVGQRLHVLNHKGDSGLDLETPGALNGGFKDDMLTLDFSTSAGTHSSGLGSLNENVAVGADGNLYVVGSFARNDIFGNPALVAHEPGFVESVIWRMPSSFSGTPTVDLRDLNRAEAPSPSTEGTIVDPPFSAAIPTGIALRHSGSTVDRVFVSSLGTDRIVVLTPAGTTFPEWTRATIDLPAIAGGAAMNGPRDLEIVSTPSGPRLYVLCDLDGSVLVYDANATPTPTLAPIARIALANRLPADQQAGRRFLYDARLSGTGKVSCASCHVEGKTDSLRWALGPLEGTPADIPWVPFGSPAVPFTMLVDGVVGGGLLASSTPGAFAFPVPKGLMVTQTLQGLVDHPANESGQFLLSEAPYHWRGDRANFDKFNEAFVNLLGATPTMGSPSSGPDAKGILDEEMASYRRFIERVMYPPNPEEPTNRKYSGDMGSDLVGLDGSGALRGMEIFHVRPFTGAVFSGRSCVECHALPGGSNQRITLTDGLDAFQLVQPLESAQLRGLVQREGVLELGPQLSITEPVVPTPRVLEAGLTHAGFSFGVPPFSVNRFVQQFFGSEFTLSQSEEKQRLIDVIAFAREFDWGVAPVIGRAVTVDASGGSTNPDLATMEDQALRANCGVAVHLWQTGGETGLYLDVPASSVGNLMYQSTGGGSPISRTTLLNRAAATGALAVFQATPVGSERRVASFSGVAPVVGSGAPSNVTLLAMRPATQWRQVAALSKNWIVGTGTDDFHWTGVDGSNTPIHTPRSLQAVRIFQKAVLGSFGVTGPHHEPPRRFRVTGANIRPGAFLRLAYSAPLSPTQPATAPPNPVNVQLLELPIFPSRDSTVFGGGLVWETSAELSPLVTFAFLNGGPFAPDVAGVGLGFVEEFNPPTSSTPQTNSLAPQTWNLFHVQVVNPGNQASPTGSWQALTVADN